jgi:hypothetical protein
LVKLVIMKLQVQATILMMISMDGSREHIIWYLLSDWLIQHFWFT